MEKHILENQVEVRELESGYEVEILVNSYNDSKALQGKNGKFIENIPKETWKKAVEENSNIELLVDHSPYVNVAENIKFDVREDGVYAIATLSSKAKNLYESIKEYGAKGVSFGFIAINDSWNGIKRTVNEMQLFEVSILMDKNPAYNGNTVSAREECRENIEVPVDKLKFMRMRLELEKNR